MENNDLQSSQNPTILDGKNYLNNRLISQREWYDKKASYHKQRFMYYQKVVIILGAIIPIVVVIGNLSVFKQFNGAEWAGLLSAIISAVIAIAAGVDKLTQPQTQWYNFRAVEEILKKEEWFFQYKCGPFTGLSESQATILLVERVENMISADMARFTASRDKKEGEKTITEEINEILAQQLNTLQKVKDAQQINKTEQPENEKTS